jgi:kinesin family protein 1
MMGNHNNPELRGIIPRLCEDLFARISQQTTPGWSAKVEVSYMEM